MIVLIAALSFAGYVAVRALGERRGLLVSAAAGAIISSTMVTLNNARLAAKSPDANPTLSIAILIAWMVSLARMTIIAVAVNPLLLGPLAAPSGRPSPYSQWRSFCFTIKPDMHGALTSPCSGIRLT